jgi:hypothetical protein
VQREEGPGHRGSRAMGQSCDKTNATNVKRMFCEKGFGLRGVPPPVGLKKSRSRDNESTNAIQMEPGDERCHSSGWKRDGARAVQVQAMARPVARVASAMGKRSRFKTKGKIELAIGLVWANAFCSENRCPAAGCVHLVDSGGDGAMLMGGQVGMGQEELTS